ncbi:HAD family acid phosphatase [Sciscionella marina]|uniref:HAD family acid phosphatase n=1 Tax=Sciscionella marina TaxID=508770 RepID=UPI000382CA82|nr:HAD family acid phosphatase [Sciscionella marina]
MGRLGNGTVGALMAAVVVIGTAGVITATTATADAPRVSAGAASEPANIDQVKTDVKNYYGDYLDASGHHHASPDSRWAKDTGTQLAKAKKFLTEQLVNGVRNPAMVLDIDDTSMLTYGWEADVNFAYDAEKAEEQIDKGNFTPIKPTLELTQWATARGVKLYFLTGRPEHQRAATERNLAAKGYPKPSGVFLKQEKAPSPWLPCGLDCNTVQYKSGTREHIEKLGNTIVLNIGDQNSDLQGGHADLGVKLPNPMYYLP